MRNVREGEEERSFDFEIDALGQNLFSRARGALPRPHRGPQAAHNRAQAPFMENLYAPSGLHALEVPEDTFVEMLLAVCKVFMSQKALS